MRPSWVVAYITSITHNNNMITADKQTKVNNLSDDNLIKVSARYAKQYNDWMLLEWLASGEPLCDCTKILNHLCGISNTTEWLCIQQQICGFVPRKIKFKGFNK